ncbi:hypothetical protein OPQ81_010708 [Rhizoctonia solani]|nr:hypothetical protein OPQ81_010708 [Rhizoctonia solani]
MEDAGDYRQALIWAQRHYWIAIRRESAGARTTGQRYTFGWKITGKISIEPLVVIALNGVDRSNCKRNAQGQTDVGGPAASGNSSDYRLDSTLRRVSRGWREVADEHPTWRSLCTMFDPYLILARPRLHLNPAQVPSQPPLNADTFRRIIRATCLVCAVSYPNGHLYRQRMSKIPQPPTYPTPSAFWGIIPACAVHRPLSFCGRCLRSEPATLRLQINGPHLALAPLAVNERDTELVRCLDLRTSSGAGIRAVCGACRGERIRAELIRGRGANMAPWMGSGFWDWDYDGADVWSVPWDGGLSRRDADRLLSSEEVAGVVNQYIEYGDWTVREAIEEMEERVWMRWWTKANEMEGLVRATAKLQRMEERAAEPLDTDDESDEDDDLLSLSDEFGLRDMIFQDWARNRILEGIWISPHMDITQYHTSASSNPELRHMPSRWAPRHPFGRVQRTPPTLPREFRCTTPISPTFTSPPPPPPNRISYNLARAWEATMRSIIGPAIANIVSRIVKECKVAEEVLQAGIDDQARRDSLRAQCVLAHGESDPCKAVSRFNADRLMEVLRGPEPWVEGGGWDDIYIDWDDGDLTMMLDRESTTPHNPEDYEPNDLREYEPCSTPRDLDHTNPREREPSLTPSSVAPTLRESVAPSPPPSTISAQSPHPTSPSELARSPEELRRPSPHDLARSPEGMRRPSPSDMRRSSPPQSSPSDLQRSSPVSTTPSPEALTSPSTMRTTPSPPPMEGKKLVGEVEGPEMFAPGAESGFVPGSRDGIFIPTTAPLQPVSPRLSRSKPLHPIPLVPHCPHYLGQHTKTVLEMLWREATGGLWMCRCTICSRAMSVQGVPTVQQPQTIPYPQSQAVAYPQAQYHQTQTPQYQQTLPYQQAQAFAYSQPQGLPDLDYAPADNWNLEPMQVEDPEVEVEGKGKGVAGRRSRERDEIEDRGERKRIRCEAGVV